nr:MAG TPA: hypothetical protein [Caudoviricetes sp.]
MKSQDVKNSVIFFKKVLDFYRDTEYNCVEIQGE